MKKIQKTINKLYSQDQYFLIIFVSILTIILGFIIDFFEGYIQWSSLFFALGLIVLIFLSISYYNHIYFHKPIADLSYEINSKIDRFVSPDMIGWLYTAEQLANFESNTNVPLVWLISSDISEDTIGGIFQKVVYENLKRNIKYKYFVPDNPDIYSKVEQLKIFYQNSKNVSYVFLDVDFYILCPQFDITIYNPLKENCLPRDGFLGLPIESGNIHFHAKINDQFIDNIIGQLLTISKTHKRKK